MRLAITLKESLRLSPFNSELGHLLPFVLGLNLRSWKTELRCAFIRGITLVALFIKYYFVLPLLGKMLLGSLLRNPLNGSFESLKRN